MHGRCDGVVPLELDLGRALETGWVSFELTARAPLHVPAIFDFSQT